jgi:hypothetical protein
LDGEAAAWQAARPIMREAVSLDPSTLAPALANHVFNVSKSIQALQLELSQSGGASRAEHRLQLLAQLNDLLAEQGKFILELLKHAGSKDAASAELTAAHARQTGTAAPKAAPVPATEANTMPVWAQALAEGITVPPGASLVVLHDLCEGAFDNARLDQ